MNLSYSTYSLEDLFLISERTIRLSEEEQFEDVISAHPLLTLLKGSFSAYQKSYGRPVFSGKGEKVAELNDIRKTLLIGFRHQVKGFAKMIGLAQRDSALEIEKILNQYLSKRAGLTYTAKSVQLTKCIEELSIKENQDKLRALGLLESFNLLKTNHLEFETLYLEQNKRNAELRSLPAAYKLRADLVERLKDYFGLVSAMRSQKGWDKLYAALKELVKSIEVNSSKSRHTDNPGQPKVSLENKPDNKESTAVTSKPLTAEVDKAN